MNVLIPVRTTAAQMQHVLILLEAITAHVSVVILEMASLVKVYNRVVNRRVYGESIAILYVKNG